MSSSPNSSSSSNLLPLPAATTEIEKLGTDGLDSRFDSLLDIRCPVSVLIGSGRITVRECLALRPKSVLQLSEAAGEDLQVLVGGVALARGEVVIVEDRTAIRLTEILKAAASEGQ